MDVDPIPHSNRPSCLTEYTVGVHFSLAAMHICDTYQPAAKAPGIIIIQWVLHNVPVYNKTEGIYVNVIMIMDRVYLSFHDCR